MSVSGQRQVPVKMARLSSYFARRTVAFSLVLSLSAWAQDGGVLLDAPKVLHLPNGHYDFNDPAFKAVDLEMKRLQQVERVHNQEPPWATPVLIGLAVGLLVGAAAGVAGTLAVKSAIDAGK